MSNSAETMNIMRAAEARLSELSQGHRRAQDAVDEEWRPKIQEARRALSEATAAHNHAVAAETQNHPLHGRRVYRMEPQFARWTAKKIGEKRIDGIVDTYRPGVDLGRGYDKAGGLNPGDPFVRLLKKDGKPGASTQHYQSRWAEPGNERWTLVDETPARDSGSDPQGEKPSGFEGEASQSGGSDSERIAQGDTP